MGATALFISSESRNFEGRFLVLYWGYFFSMKVISVAPSCNGLVGPYANFPFREEQLLK